MNERFHALVFSIFFVCFVCLPGWQKVKNKYREERRRRRREKNEYACDNISLFQKGKKKW
jgi:hypothetical protein